MSRKKRTGQEAAAQEAPRIEQEIKITHSNKGWRGKLRSSSASTVVAAVLLLLLAFGAVAATLIGTFAGSNNSGSPSSGTWFNKASQSSSTSALAPVAAVSPAAVQLSKEYLYAASRTLAVEDAAAAQAQPADLVVWRPSGGVWYIKDSTNGTTSGGQFGVANDKPAPADFDGDGMADFCVFRPQSDGLGMWHIQGNASGAYRTAQWGLGTDVPVPADYDGDGLADVAVWRASSGYWYVLQSSTNTIVQRQFGASGDKVLPADYDGDRRADFAVYRESNKTWHIVRSSDNQYQAVQFGVVGDQAIRGDFDGDGRFDLAVLRTSANAVVYLSSATGGINTIAFTGMQVQAGDIAVGGDYDKDGKTDAAVWRPASGVWFIKQSATNTMRVDQWGMSGDVPIPAAMKR